MGCFSAPITASYCTSATIAPLSREIPISVTREPWWSLASRVGNKDVWTARTETVATSLSFCNSRSLPPGVSRIPPPPWSPHTPSTTQVDTHTWNCMWRWHPAAELRRRREEEEEEEEKQKLLSSWASCKFWAECSAHVGHLINILPSLLEWEY